MAEPVTKEAILASILERAREFGGLRECDYDLNLPLLINAPESPLACRETQDEFGAINASFSTQIHAFFEALREFESRSTSTDGDEFIRAEGLQPSIRVINQSFDIFPSCLHRSFHSRRLFLVSNGNHSNNDQDAAASLPQLSRVTVLRIGPEPNYASDIAYENARPLSPALLLQLAIRCPNLRRLECPWLWERTPSAFVLRSMRHFTRPWEGPWRDARREFGRAVTELGGRLPESLVSARLWFWRPGTVSYREGDQAALMPDLVGPEGEDPVSLGLRELGGRLEELDVRAFVTPDLFRAPMAWRRMKRLRVEFHPWCSDGTWYFAGPGDDKSAEPEKGFEVTEEHYPPDSPDELDEEVDEEYADEEGTDEEAEFATNMFRTEPIPSKIEPLLLGFAEALKGMPALEEAELFAWLAWHPSEEMRSTYGGADEAPFNMDRTTYRWGVKYAPGSDGGKGVVTWQVGPWRPHENVIRAFETLNGENGGVDTVWNALGLLDRRNDLHPTDYH